MSDTVLHVKVAGAGGWSGDVSVVLDASTGSILKDAVMKASGVPVDEIKLLCAGRFLKDEVILSEQKVKPNARILVMKKRLQHDVDQMVVEEQAATTMNRQEDIVDEIANRTDSTAGRSSRYFELENQAGDAVQLAESDRRALTQGMTWHAKAKARIRAGEYKEALHHLEKADQGFLACQNNKILSQVDNYSYLCLDIAWVYYKLQDPRFFEQAQKRLATARMGLERAHGPDLQRLRAVKADVGADLTLHTRLDLLDAIVAFHNGKVSLAVIALNTAERHLKGLLITDDMLVDLIGMGFGREEARKGLLAARGGGSQAAIVHILRQREEDEQRKAKDVERDRLLREKRARGKTADGHWVDLTVLNSLTTLGFNKDLATEGLKQTNNNANKTIDLLTTSRDLLETALVESNAAKQEREAKKQKKKWESSLSKLDMDAAGERVAEVMAMGFDYDVAVGTLLSTEGDMLAAGAKFVFGRGGGAPPGGWCLRLFCPRRWKRRVCS
eukprot:TRINITY_DN1376_c0_g1_i2.p1 TRINITY_DN1376_c0_g1~~TRINITY_DN1376_c0_g1_i2.p1  ORF type:complete len:501 (+),score=93.66 TRINITY_DN1376_c0_g1_i2:141-1643(+)